MQFRGHSLPVHQSMSVSWALLCPISSAKSAYAISFDYWPWNVSLPSGASLRNGMIDRVECQYTTVLLLEESIPPVSLKVSMSLRSRERLSPRTQTTERKKIEKTHCILLEFIE